MLALAVVMAAPALGVGSDQADQPDSQDVRQPASLISPRVGETDEAQLKERVLVRWQALVKGDFDAAYQFETPAYRAAYTPSQFRYQFGNQTLWRMANIIDIHYDDPIVARVQVEIAYRYAEPAKGHRMQDMTQQVNETWLRKEEQWWHQQD